MNFSLGRLVKSSMVVFRFSVQSFFYFFLICINLPEGIGQRLLLVSTVSIVGSVW